MGKHKGKTQKNRQTGGQAGRPDGKTWYDRVGESYEPGIKYGITEEAAAGETDRQPEETGQRGKNRNGQAAAASIHPTNRFFIHIAPFIIIIQGMIKKGNDKPNFTDTIFLCLVCIECAAKKACPIGHAFLSV